MARRLASVIGGRLVVGTLLLGGSSALEGLDSTPPEMTAIVIAMFFASLVSLVWLRGGRALGALARTQVAIDLALATALVALTGGALSTFSFLYGVVILTASLVTDPTATVATAGLAGVLFLAVGIGVPPESVTGESHALDAGSELGVALLRNGVGLFLVGWLAQVLSERLRRTRGELARANESAAESARLTEDIVRSIRAGLITTDLSGAVRTINPAAARILEAGVEAVGRSISEILPLVAERHEHQRADVHARTGSGRSVPIGYTRAPLIGSEGAVLGSLVVFQDLTEVTELRQKAERAERLAALGRLAAGLAHEIRNPLGSISGSVELVRDAPSLSEEDRRLLDLVLREVERLNELVSTMLELGRPRPPEKTEVDLLAMASEVVEVAARGSDGARITLEGQHLTMQGDPSQLRQVLWNMVKNALQHCPRDPILVRVVPEAGGVRLEVEDSGPGITAEDLPHVFDMFFSKRKHGVGLGLALVKQIAEAHGGAVSVTSVPGQGARFMVWFPVNG